ncbi:MAG: anhydro-N-acetylmuramic acid kinase [Geminicoccaceae bacterium]
MPVSPLDRLQALAAKPDPVIAGLMTGTSMDGLDIAFCRIGPQAEMRLIETLATETVPMPSDLRRQIEASMGGDLYTAARVDMDLGRWFADATFNLAQRHGIRIDLVGSHGQTVYHEHGRTTLQIGEPGYLARRLGCVVAHDFRRADVVLGGCGAPLVPVFDQLMLGRRDETVLSINIGGIANLTIIPPLRHSNEEPLAFDCGPGNMVIDRIMERRTGGRMMFDAGGAEAARGAVDELLMTDLMAHPFLTAPPPKSAGREQFGHAFTDALVDRINPQCDDDWRDLLATVTSWTAAAILSSIRGHKIEYVFVGGGGARNTTLMTQIEAGLGPGKLHDLCDAGIDPDFKEALAFALLARLLIDGEPGNVPRVTGASLPGLMGRLTFPP